jgi:hypothetical protein
MVCHSASGKVGHIGSRDGTVTLEEADFVPESGTFPVEGVVSVSGKAAFLLKRREKASRTAVRVVSRVSGEIKPAV